MIGTPSYDGRLDVYYVNSLIETMRLAPQHGVEIVPIWVSFDSLVQRARNDTVHIAIQMNVDDLVWIDSDIKWNPEWFYKLLDYNLDVVGGTYPKKADDPTFVMQQNEFKQLDPATGLVEVSALGTGFVKMSRAALHALWNSSQPYIDPKDNLERRHVFDVSISGGNLVSEDINAFHKLTRAGFKCWLDVNICCDHIGQKRYSGSFKDWWLKVQMERIEAEQKNK